MSPKDGVRLALILAVLILPPAFAAYRLGRKHRASDYERMVQ